SFAPAVTFAGGGDSVVIGDLDGDGKADVAVGSWNKGTLTVFRNTGTGPGIDTNTFAPKVDFIANGSVHHIAAGDLDGDGKPDIALVTEQPSYLSIFKNISTPGSFTSASLAPHVDYPSGENAAGVALGDLDGDGQLDVAFANSYDSTLSIYR